MKVELHAGEHTCMGAFYPRTEGDDVDANMIERPVLLVYEGEFESMDGPVSIKQEHLDRLVSNHNSLYGKVKRLAAGDVPARFMPPLQLDHSRSAAVTVGRVPGELSHGTYDDPTDGKTKKAVYGRVRVLGKENVEKIKDGRYTHVSIGADLEEGKLNELSITPFPAAAMASILSKGKRNLGGHMPKEETKEKTEHYDMAKFKKHLTEVKKMADKDADEHLAKMPDDEKEKLAKEVDEHEKMAKPADPMPKQDVTPNMSAEKKAKFVQLTADFRKSYKSTELKAREGKVSARLSKLRASAKITPAEVKKINVTRLAQSNDVTIEAVLKSYEDREPVIPVGLYGSMNATSLAGITKDMQMTALEKESRMNMPMKRQTAMGEGVDKMPKQDATPNMAGDKPDKMPHQDVTPHMTAMAEVMSHLEKDEKDEAMSKLKAYVDKMAGGYAGPESYEDSEKQMSALAESVNQLHNKFEEFVKLTSVEFGLNLE